MAETKPKYVIKCIAPRANTEYTYYVACGGTYQVQGEKYVCTTTDISKAKHYKSKKVAENAYNKLFESCANLDTKYEIVEVL
ncbi:MAG: hypothetical protein UGF89_06505 [Acutalibacteraceae bacterium]|nr:hypothetical protein [Acutalibacteraceae bacterium]